MNFDPDIERAYQLALLGDHTRWDEFVLDLGLMPLNEANRAAIRQMDGVPKMKGVLPCELRVVLEMLCKDPVMVEREMLRFVGAAQPPKVALKGIFANAQRTAVRVASEDRVTLVPCETCGAPPQSELSTLCAFCGGRLQ